MANGSIQNELPFSFSRLFHIPNTSGWETEEKTYTSDVFAADFGLSLKTQMFVEGTQQCGFLKFELFGKTENQKIRISSTTMTITSENKKETYETGVFPDRIIPTSGNVNNSTDFQKIYEHESNYQKSYVERWRWDYGSSYGRSTGRCPQNVLESRLESVDLPNTFYAVNRDLTLTVKGKISLIKIKSEELVNDMLDQPVLSDNVLVNHLYGLLENPQYSDVDVSVNGKLFSVHKNILWARSEGFAEILRDMEFATSGNNNSVSNIIKIDDFYPDVIQEVLVFMYTGICPKIKEMAVDFLAFADKFKMDDLKMLCETEIQSTITVTDVCQIFDLADKCNAVNLKLFCIEFFKINSKEIIGGNSWYELKKSNPNAVMTLMETVILDKK